MKFMPESNEPGSNQEFYRIRKLPPYVFAVINEMKAQARAAQQDVIDLGMGNPDVDWRADIYALGAVGYWLLTGQPVFEGSTPMQVVMAHIQKAPAPPSRRTDQKIPGELEEILLACLQKDPNNRPQTMQELGQRLKAIPLENPWTQERARRWWLEKGTQPHARKMSQTPTPAAGAASPAPAAIGRGVA